MNFRITVLCENSVGPISGTLGEHGFAALIEPSGGEAILFDTGQGLTLLHNARRMNKNLSAVGKVALSHGHFDHAGGLLPYLQECGPRRVYGHTAIFTPRYRVKDTGECLPIGLPQGREQLERAGAAFDLSTAFRELAPGVHLTGEIPRVTAFETGDQGLYRDCTGQELDVTIDDQSLVLETGRGLVVVLGCCHAGVINTLEHIASTTGRRDVYALIGGTHLAFCGREQAEKTVQAVKEWGIRKIAAGHCTGFAAAARLSREVPREFQVAQVGYTLEV
ncbi:MBL fold metallo-hydrolase [Geobacter sp. FeAm09]|uniref:MBL fold metallo-hydrolase n=1 Tax=Geobacter sp. FeAm09 TaxID=2597769 RepID=UPI0011F0660C|nr:MBL fold metallo-hydrolase [Geobacter sp. FeAm09]QEM68708.1 MBL fold metallo-hydrolase [Geobacter sp. FeAm09]